MMMQNFMGRKLWLLFFCLCFLAVAFLILPGVLSFAGLFGVAVSTGIDLGDNEFVRSIAEMLLAPKFNLWVIAMLLISFVVGFSVTKNWGLRPAFPWQSEHYRNWANRVAVICMVLAWLTPLAQVIYMTSAASVSTTLTVLYKTDQTAVLYMILLLPFVVMGSALIAYFAGLALPTHIGVPWMLPSWLGGTAKIIYQVATRIDPILGAAGEVLTAIYNSSNSSKE